jgi:hypothetical protein
MLLGFLGLFMDQNCVMEENTKKIQKESYTTEQINTGLKICTEQ